MAFYATTEPGSAFLVDTRPADLVGVVGLVNFATAGDPNRAVTPEDATAYYSVPGANAVLAFQNLADRAAAQGGIIAWEGEAGGAASPGVRYGLTGDGVSDEGSWLLDQPGALTRIAYHGGVLDILRARQPGLSIGFEFGLPASATPAAAASNGTAYADLRAAEDAALAAKVNYRIVPAFTPNADQVAWRAQVDFFGDQIPGGVPVMLMVNHTIGANNGSNYDPAFWRYQLDTAAEKGWDVLLYNLAGPRAEEAWAVVRVYPGTSIVTNYELLAYRRLKAILLAHAPLTTSTDPAYIRERDWVWYDGNADDPEFPTRNNRVPADFPRLALEPSGQVREMWEARQRYGDNNVNATAASLARNKAVTFNFTVRITHASLRFAMNTAVEAEVLKALESSTPTLRIPGGAAGYPWVRGWGPVAASRTMGLVEGDDSGTARMQSVIPIPVYTLFNSADLLA